MDRDDSTNSTNAADLNTYSNDDLESFITAANSSSYSPAVGVSPRGGDGSAQKPRTTTGGSYTSGPTLTATTSTSSGTPVAEAAMAMAEALSLREKEAMMAAVEEVVTPKRPSTPEYSSKILVIGCHGTVGRHVTEMLLDAEVAIRITTRCASEELCTDAEIAKWRARGAEVVYGFDLDKSDSISRALVGVQRLYFSTTYTPNMLQQGLGLLERARDAGVEYVVRLSSAEAEADETQYGRWHRLLERRIEHMSFKYTLLRPNLMFQSLLRLCPELPTTRRLVLPISSSQRISWVDARDVAAVAVAALGGAGHEGDIYHLTGCESLTLPDMVGVINTHLAASAAAGDAKREPIEFATEDESDFVARLEAQLGWDRSVAEALSETLQDYAHSDACVEISNDLELVVDRPPIRFAQFVRDSLGPLLL